MIYFRFLWRSHRNFLLFCMAVISLLQFLILKLVTTLDTAGMMPMLLEQLPEGVKTMFGDDFLSMASVEGAAAIGMNHPLVLVILSLVAILIPSRHLAGEIETGTLELLLSFPIQRTRLLLGLFASTGAFLLMIVLSAWVSSLLSISIFHELTPLLFVKQTKVSCNLLLLAVTIMSLSLLLSSMEKDGNKVGSRAAGITLFFFLLHYLSSLWETIRFTKPFNIFNYYRPNDLMSGQRSFLLHLAVLGTLIVLCLAASLVQFHRRDIPG